MEARYDLYMFFFLASIHLGFFFIFMFVPELGFGTIYILKRFHQKEYVAWDCRSAIEDSMC